VERRRVQDLLWSGNYFDQPAAYPAAPAYDGGPRSHQIRASTVIVDPFDAAVRDALGGWATH
jgi:hypothetical protein